MDDAREQPARRPDGERAVRVRRGVVVLLLGALLTAGLGWAGWRADDAESAARDREARAQAVGALQTLMAGLDARVNDVVGLFASSRTVEADEFRRFTQRVVASGAAEGLSYVENVAAPDRAAFERRTGRPITGLGGGTSRGRAFPIRFAVVRGTPRNVVGQDVLASPGRRATVLRAVRTGRTIATPPVLLAATGEPGFLLYAPVPRVPGGQGLDAAAGVVSGSFRMTAAVDALQDAVSDGTRLDVTVGGREISGGPATDPGRAVTAVRLLGQRWAIRAQAGPADGLRLGPTGIGAGILLTLLALVASNASATRLLLARGRVDRARAERRFRDTFAAAPIGMALVRPAGEVVDVNDAFRRLLGRDTSAIEGHRAIDDVAAADRDAAAGLFARARRAPGTAVSDELRLHTAAGMRWIDAHVTYLEDEGLLLIQAIDVSERLQLQDRLRHQAEHDALTDLFDRRGFRRILAEHLEAAEGRPTGAVMLLDLDHFKTVNDLLGHRVGDELLRGTARVLRRSLRSEDCIARLGGDEFAVLLPRADEQHARSAASRLVADIQTETRLAGIGGGHGVSASIGVAMLVPGMGAEDALVAADLAMYDAKEAGRGRFALFEGQTATPSATRDSLEWVDRIRGALAHDRLRLLAQPIRDVRTGRTVQHELLLRLDDPEVGEVAPGAFLGIAERFGLIGAIDLWVARRAIALLAATGGECRFHMNVSGHSVGDPELLRTIRTELARTGVDPGRLVVEITETAAVTNFEQARTFTEELSAIGCLIALDDFGAGFGSFTYLKQLPVDVLKIDGQFVRNCTRDVGDRVILESLVHAASGLDKLTVAEFVEDEATERLVRELGVDFVQGYHAGRPGPVSAVLAQDAGEPERSV